MKSKADFLGSQIDIGDNVVFMQVDYRKLLRGIVWKMAERTCIIRHKKTNTGSKETKQFYNQIIKISNSAGEKVDEIE